MQASHLKISGDRSLYLSEHGESQSPSVFRGRVKKGHCKETNHRKNKYFVVAFYNLYDGHLWKILSVPTVGSWRRQQVTCWGVRQGERAREVGQSVVLISGGCTWE